MATFAKALVKEPKLPTFIVGDLVPIPQKRHYDTVIDFVNSIASQDIYYLKGNHDGDEYNSYFGLENYAVNSPELAIIMLDNSKRKFSEATLEFLEKTLNEIADKPIIIMFHIPLPNSYTTNSISKDETNRLFAIIGNNKNRVKAIVAGHVHSYFEDSINGIPHIVTGGAGARIEFVNSKLKKEWAKHHLVKFKIDKSTISWEHTDLDSSNYRDEIDDSFISANLNLALKNEIEASFRYRLLADRFKESGKFNLAKLFRALSDSEYHHGVNHFLSLEKDKPLLDELQTSIKSENFEVGTLYPKIIEYAKEERDPLTK
jgi:hypothetical protein